ncbi:MAG: nucleotidyltransferase family protein, partial [Clostridia bacterium]|nr:nucleotidyltransferase family protein [Clostridia bacterium]
KKNSYIVAREKALKSLGEQITTGSNDILAIEYLRAIRRINPQIKPLPIQRNGCNYNDVEISNMMSASGIREQFYLSEKFLSVPQNALESYEKDAFLGAVLDKERAEQFLYMKILSSSPEQISKAFDAPDGSGYFIYELAKSSVSSNEFFEKLTSKAYTYARLRRVVIYFALGIEKINKEISFAQLLCADKNGRVLLKKIKHEESIKIITKHADSRVLDENELKIYYLDKKIDEIYQGLLSKPQAPNGAYKKNAIII